MAASADLEQTIAAFHAISVAENDSAAELPRITLISADGERIQTDYRSACVSLAIAAHLEANAGCREVTIPELSGPAVRQIVRWMEHHRDLQPIDMVRVVEMDDDHHDEPILLLSDWNLAFFMSLDRELLLEIVPASFIMLLEDLLKLYEILLENRPQLREAIYPTPEGGIWA